jgi:spermidine synthase
MARDARTLPLLLMVASGFAGLGYQIVWTQQLASWLGHESAAVLAVVTAFFGGLAAGALLLGSRIQRSARPTRWYAACELAISLWSLALVYVLPLFSAWALRLTGSEPGLARQWAVAFVGVFLLLLPATAAMGATLPAAERITLRLRAEGQSIALLYGGNTLGAVLGVLAAAFWLVPELGLVRTTLVCAALNFGCGAGALAAFADSAPVRVERPRVDRASANRLLLLLAATGLLGIGYEVLVVRVLSQVTEGTVYTFSALLAVYLVGSAAGAFVYQRLLVARQDDDELTKRLLAALATACLLGAATLQLAERVRAAALDSLGGGVAAAILAEAVPALFAFGPATFVMGALFSHLAKQASASGIGIGRALGVNTLAAALAPGLFGVLAAPALGAKVSLVLIALGYLALIGRRSWFRPLLWLPASAALALLLFAPPLTFIDVPEGGHVVSSQEGAMAAVTVVEDADGVARLRINNRAQEGSSATQRVDGRQAWLPLLLHRAPRQALFLGLGTGITASSAAEDPTLHVDAVELVPEVVAASAHFAHALADGAALRKVDVRVADARRYVRASQRSYDVIVADNFHPARSGSGSLYTVEHFEAVRTRLAQGGLFCQWLPFHQLDRETLRSIVKSFLAVYPRGSAMIASNSLETPVLGLVGRADSSRFEASAVRERLAKVALPERVASIGLEDDFAVLGSFVAGPASLERLSEGAPANTDDRPVVAYRAPRITYAPDSGAADRFISLLQELSIEPGELVGPTTEASWQTRLVGYWAARNRFVESGRGVRPSARVKDMLAQVREPLLAVLRQSPDFRPAYDPLLAMAAALARSDVADARTLLTELMLVQPARNEAAQVLTLLSAGVSSAGPARR